MEASSRKLATALLRCIQSVKYSLHPLRAYDGEPAPVFRGQEALKRLWPHFQGRADPGSNPGVPSVLPCSHVLRYCGDKPITASQASAASSKASQALNADI